MLDSNVRIDPPLLEEYSNSAAVLYTDKKVPLSRAVYTIIKDKPMTMEHLKRVLRGANVKAYLLEYDRMDGDRRVVNFEGGLARLEEILSMLDEDQLKEASMAPKYDTSIRDYMNEPEDYKVKKIAAAIEPPPPKSKDPLDFGNLYLTIKAAGDRLGTEIMRLTNRQHDLVSEFNALVKQAILDDHSIGDVIRVTLPEPTKELTDAVLKVARQLPTKFWTDDEILESLEKKSSFTPDPSNALRAKWAQYSECAKLASAKERTRLYLKGKEQNVLDALRVKHER